MNPTLRRFVAGGLSALLLSLVAASPLHAAESATLITLDPPAPVAWGARATVTAHLWLEGGVPVAGHHLGLHLGGAVAGGQTDATGTATFDIGPPAVPGVYPMQVTFDGSISLLPSQTDGTLTVQPRLFTIHAIPANPGLKFNLGGTEFVTDAAGIAQLEVPSTFDRSLRPKTANLVVSPGVEERFDRWRILNGDLYATYEMYYDIIVRFVDLAGNEVDPTRVTSVDLRGSIGNQLKVEPGVPFEVLGQRVVPLGSELVQKDVEYSVEDVVVDGASAVHRAQQRFTPSGDRVWTITLLFYAVHLSVRDAIFGFPLDSEIGITYPDGRNVAVAAPGGELSLSALARGDYSVTAKSWGMSFQRPIALSRDQTVELKVISFLDIGVVAGIGLLIVFGLLLVGSPAARGAVPPMLQRLRLRLAMTRAPEATPLAATIATRIGQAPQATRIAAATAVPVRPPKVKPSRRATKAARRATSTAPSTSTSTSETQTSAETARPGLTNGSAGVPKAPPARKVRPAVTKTRVAVRKTPAAAPTTPPALPKTIPAAPTPAAPTIPAAALDTMTRLPAAGFASAAPHQASILWEVPRVQRTYVVQEGDTLQSIAAVMLGDENTWQDIVAANPKVTMDRGHLIPGTKLKIP